MLDASQLPIRRTKSPKASFPGGLALWVDWTLSAGRSVAMLSATQLQLGRGVMRVQLAQQAQKRSLGKVSWSSSRSGSTMWRSPLGRWSRWAYRRSWTGLSRAIGHNGGSVGGGRRGSGWRLSSRKAITGKCRWKPPQGHATHPERPDRSGHRATGFS